MILTCESLLPDNEEGVLAPQAPLKDTIEVEETNEGELATQETNEGERATQAPLLPRSEPPLTRARARALGHLVLTQPLFSGIQRPTPMLTMLKVQDEVILPTSALGLKVIL